MNELAKLREKKVILFLSHGNSRSPVTFIRLPNVLDLSLYMVLIEINAKDHFRRFSFILPIWVI